MTIEASFHIQRDTFRLAASFTIPDRGVTALFGPSGCGKTSILRAIAGLDRHTSSRFCLGNRIWQDTDTFLPAHQRRVGYVFQQATLFPHLTVRENILFGHKRSKERISSDALARLISLLGIEHLQARKPAGLSGGEQQRVAIARALATGPELLLLDEPLAALDATRKDEILPYIDALSTQLHMPVIYVSHSADEVARLADHLVLLDSGTVIASGTITEMLTRLDLPLAHSPDAEALIEATVAAHDEKYHLTYVDIAAGRFTVPYKPLTVGSRVRVRVSARDVSLTLAHQTETSILNIFPAEVNEIVEENPAQVMVRLKLKDAVILSRITKKSAARLALAPGKSVYAQAKTVALLS